MPPSSNASPPVPPAVVGFVGAAFVGVAGMLVAARTSLYGDGAYYLLRTIQTGDPAAVPGREAVNGLREAAVVAAVRLGITDIGLLSILQGIGFVLLPALAWTCAAVRARVSRARFVLVALGGSVSFALLIVFSASELSLALPLVVLISVLLADGRPWSLSAGCSAVVATAVLLAAHESVALCAGLIVAQALIRVYERLGRIDAIAGLAVAAGAATAGVAALWRAAEHPAGDDGGLLAGLPTLHPHAVVAVIGATVLAAAWTLAPWRGLLARAASLVLLGYVIVLLSVGLTPFVDDPALSYRLRGLSLVVVLLLQGALLTEVALRRFVFVRPVEVYVPLGRLVAVAAFLAVALSVPVRFALPWQGFVADLRETVAQHTGVLDQERVVQEPDRRFLWAWTTPTLSVLLCSSPPCAVVDNGGYAGWQPFAPIDAGRQLPPRVRWG